MNKIYGDRLSREEYVDECLNLIGVCLANNTSTAFSIEGAWGQGKTWLIKKIEASLKNIDLTKSYCAEEFDRANGEYFVVHYNAWEKDYYDEPLLAILLTIVNELNKQFVEYHTLIKLTKDLLGHLEDLVGAISQRLLHINIVKFGKDSIKAIKKFRDDSKINLGTNNKFESIENDIKKIVVILNEIASKYPIIFVVDELDRCVPNFAIKTLERLHHIFEKVKSSVTILAFNREQLHRSINHAYGDGSAERYLKKFIDFRVILNSGNANEAQINAFLRRFSKLFQNTTKINPDCLNVIYDYCENFTPREFENIISRAILCHKLIGEDTTSYPIECMIAEIILQANLNINEFEGHHNNVSPEYGNRAETTFGKLQKEYFIELKKTYGAQLVGNGIIAYILNIVLGYNYTFSDAKLNTDLGRKIKKYYSKYRTYYFMIQTP